MINILHVVNVITIGLISPGAPTIGLVTFHSQEIIWENDLDEANEVHDNTEADERIQVIVDRHVPGLPEPDSWRTVYKLVMSTTCSNNSSILNFCTSWQSSYLRLLVAVLKLR